MNEQQGLFTQLGVLLDRHFSQRRAAIPQPAATRCPGWMRWLVRQMVPNVGTLLLVAVLILTQQVWARPLLSPASAPGPSATTVNYQGRLADHSGNPLDGTYGMTFALWDAATGGNLVWGPESHAAVPVSQGLFSVGLGGQTSGGIPTSVWNGDRYLEIAVGGETLSPRELIRSVPIAGMALTVPDGAVKSSNLDLDHGMVCLSTHARMNLPGNYQNVDVPGLSLTLSLAKPSQVLIWMDGLAVFDDGASIGEASVQVSVDGEEKTASWHWTDDNMWFGVKGQRILNLGGGSHSISAVGNAQYPGTLTVHGIGSLRTCINYLILGEQ